MTTKDDNGVFDDLDDVFFIELIKSLMEDLKAGATVSEHTFTSRGMEVSFQVRVKKLNGERLPAMTTATVRKLKRRTAL